MRARARRRQRAPTPRAGDPPARAGRHDALRSRSRPSSARTSARIASSFASYDARLASRRGATCIDAEHEKEDGGGEDGGREDETARNHVGLQVRQLNHLVPEARLTALRSSGRAHARQTRVAAFAWKALTSFAVGRRRAAVNVTTRCYACQARSAPHPARKTTTPTANSFGSGPSGPAVKISTSSCNMPMSCSSRGRRSRHARRAFHIRSKFFSISRRVSRSITGRPCGQTVEYAVARSSSRMCAIFS